MGNSFIDNKRSSDSNQVKNNLILNYKLQSGGSKTTSSNNNNSNKKSNLDLFRNTENNINNLKEIKRKGNINANKSVTKIKNKSINEENNNNFLRKINNNPIKKIKSQMKKDINSKILKEDVKLDNNNQKSIFINQELKNNEKEQNAIKINQNLYEFEINNDKYFHYRDEYNKNKFLQKSEEILTSERTINITNSDAEFLDNITKNDKITDKNNNNIFGNISKYELKKNNNKAKNKDIVGIQALINAKMLKKNNNKNKSIQNKEIKIKINDIKYRKIKAKSKQDTHKKDDGIIRVHQANNNNLLLISNFVSKSNTYSRNKVNKSEVSLKINKTYHKQEVEENNNNDNIHKNFSFKNISNNIICLKNPNINSYKENNKLNLKKIRNKRNNNTKIKTSSNYSYNYNNFYICNNDYNSNNNIFEKRKMAELIKKIPNNELKNELMCLYQKIINYNNEIIINDKNGYFDYIITFSNNYIKIDEKEFIKKEFNKNNLNIKNEIKISLLPNKKAKERANSCNIKEKSEKNNSIKNTKNTNKDINIKTNNKKLNQNTKNNYLSNNQNSNKESAFKRYTFEQYKKYESENANFKNSKKYFEFSEANLTSKIKTISQINYSSQKEKEKGKSKIEINTINPKAWKKIINLNEVTINKEKIFPFTVIEKNSHSLIKEIITRNNENGNDIMDLNKEKDLRNHSVNVRPKKENNNELNKTSKSIDVIRVKENLKNMNKNDKKNPYNVGKEKIIFQQNLKKLIKVKNLLKDIKKYHKNFIFKEEDLIMINTICLISLYYIFIFKDKEKKYPMFKKKLNSIKSIMSFKKNCKYIIIIELGNGNRNNEKDKYLGLLIENEKNYNEFIGFFSQLIPKLEIIFLN